MNAERGLTFRRAELHLDPLTEKDLRDLDFVAAHADMVGVSFEHQSKKTARLRALRSR